MSPLATLDRGYAILRDAESGAVLMDAEGSHPGQDVRAQLSQGELIATIKKVVIHD